MFLQMPCKAKTDDFDLQIRINKTKALVQGYAPLLHLEQGGIVREESLGASDTFYRNSPLRLSKDFYQVTQFLLSLGLLLYKMRAILSNLLCIHFICSYKRPGIQL